MLLQLENTSRENINRLIDFANGHNLKLELVDFPNTNYHLPGKPLNNEELLELMIKSRNSGSVNMVHAHEILRESLNAN